MNLKTWEKLRVVIISRKLTKTIWGIKKYFLKKKNKKKTEQWFKGSSLVEDDEEVKGQRHWSQETGEHSHSVESLDGNSSH